MDVTHPGRRRMAGATLIDSLATSSVALALTATAVPAFNTLVAVEQTATTVNTVSTDLALARHAAATYGERVAMCPSNDRRSCTGGYDWSEGWLVFRDPNANRTPDPGERLLGIREPTPAGVTVLTSTGRRVIVYRSDGTMGGTNATFRICNRSRPDRNRSLIINRTGRHTLSKTDTEGDPVVCG